MSRKYSTKQHISAQYCAKQMSETWRKNIQAFLRYSNFRLGIFYFATPCTLCPEKVVRQTHGDNCQFLTDFQNYFTAGKPGKFLTKPI